MKISTLHATLASRVSVPGSKSHTNRALLLSALAKGTTTLENALFSDDSRYFVQALNQLGFDLALDEDTKTMTVHGRGGHIPVRKADLFIGNAGTAARFLTAMLTLGQGQYSIDGIARMRERPIGDLVDALNQLGCNIKGPDQHSAICPPVTITASGLPGPS